MKTNTERRYDLDWLRVLGVLLLVPFHVALIFVFEPFTIMYIRDSVNSRVLAEVTGFIHMWHMPMLFMIAGAATYFALGHRSGREYIRERFWRLFLPLVVGLLTYVPLTIHIQHSDSFSWTAGYTRFFHIDLNRLDGMTGNFTPAHLWFILFLFVFSVAGLPLLQWLRTEKGRSVIERWGTAAQSPLSLIAPGIPLTLAAATGILGDMNPLYYFQLFFFGFVFASDTRFQTAVDKLTWGVLAFGIVAAGINIIFPIRTFAQWTAPWLVLGLIYQLGRWALTLAMLGLGHRFLNFANPILRYASEAAMPFYLLHMPFSVIIGYFVVQLNAAVEVKYPLIVIIVTLLTLFTYELIRRWNGIRWLFGMKLKQAR